jgi:hypothetical protein
MKIIIFISGFFLAVLFLMLMGWTISSNVDDDLEDNVMYKKTEHWLQLQTQNTILCWLFAVICGAVSVYVFT